MGHVCGGEGHLLPWGGLHDTSRTGIGAGSCDCGRTRSEEDLVIPAEAEVRYGSRDCC